MENRIAFNSIDIGQGVGVETKSTISGNNWRRLLNASVVGNGIFPQSFFAQGILLADEMTRLSYEEDIPLRTLLSDNPPDNLIRAILEPAKNIANKAHGFETRSTLSVTHSLYNVWSRDKSHGERILRNFAQLFSNEKHRQISKFMSTSSLVSDLHKDPLFNGMLGKSSEMLVSPPVYEISDEYRNSISGFMIKYANASAANRPPEYVEEQEDLMHHLSDLLRTAAINIKAGLLDYLQTDFPKSIRLQSEVSMRTIDDLFGFVCVADIDPLRRNEH